MITWISELSRLGRILLIAGIAAIVIVLAIILWPRDDNEEVAAQASATTAHTEAIATAAAGAIEVLQDRVITDKNVDAAVKQTKGEIENAKDVAAIRASVVASLCKRPAYSRDPACTVQ